MPNAPKKPTLAHPLTWEEMRPDQRELYGRPPSQRGPGVPETIYRYDPFRDFDDAVASFHRKKSDE
jgi:hypothetical protein